MDLVPLFLESKASLWWKDVVDRLKSYHEGLYGQRHKELRWIEFMKEFLNKYHSETTQDQKRIEFDELVHGNMMIHEYKRKFSYHF